MNGNRESRWLLMVYAVTVFVSAFLLFQVQPMISRRILPWFGGTPAVWTTCMLFFQSVLFLGYAYAHTANSKMTPKWQALMHFILLLGALAFARIAPADYWKPHDASAPIGRILLLLAACVGVPYFVLATTGPLLQAWFSRTFACRSPYRLYALSNVGSLLALLSYPFWFEPRYGLNQQTWLWFGGFALFATLCALVAFQLWRSPLQQPSGEVDAPAVAGEIVTPEADVSVPNHGEANPYRNWVLWLLLPAFGSIMLLATTNHVCQDVAVVPFLWVVPLSVYLLTFIIAFDHPRWYQPLATALVTAVSLYAVAAVYFLAFKPFNLAGLGHIGPYLDKQLQNVGWLFGSPPWAQIAHQEFVIKFVGALGFYFAALFFVCLLCHGQLARLRPSSQHLTAYYLLISAGGALGGILVSLVAPLVFTTFLEWKLGVFVSYILAMLVAIAAWPRPSGPLKPMAGAGLMALRVVVFVLMLAGLFEVVTFLEMGGSKSLAAVRNFYGTVTIREFDKGDSDLHSHVMFNGRIIHGLQFTHPKRKSEPTTYYTRKSGVGLAIEALRDQRPDAPNLKVGAVGLGIGTLAAYAKPGDQFCFYEINPVAEQFARNTQYFTYLSDHADQVKVELGDARLTLERQPPQNLNLLVLDAFSGDAIPTHLLTREAFEIYRGHLAKDGAIAIHVTNKYFDLRPVVLAGAEQLGMDCVTIETFKEPGAAGYHAKWMILTRDKKLSDNLRQFAHDDDDVFFQKDANHDQQLTLEEWQLGVPARKQPAHESEFRAIDVDKDGRVTRREHENYWMEKWTDDHSDPLKLLTR